MVVEALRQFKLKSCFDSTLPPIGCLPSSNKLLLQSSWSLIPILCLNFFLLYEVFIPIKKGNPIYNYITEESERTRDSLANCFDPFYDSHELNPRCNLEEWGESSLLQPSSSPNNLYIGTFKDFWKIFATSLGFQSLSFDMISCTNYKTQRPFSNWKRNFKLQTSTQIFIFSP